MPYQVEEYEELTANQRCRRSGNMRVNPAGIAMPMFMITLDYCRSLLFIRESS